MMVDVIKTSDNVMVGISELQDVNLTTHPSQVQKWLQ
jgi:hypothetical protein